MMDTSSVFECDYSSGEEAYNYNIDVPFYRGVDRSILPRSHGGLQQPYINEICPQSETQS